MSSSNFHDSSTWSHSAASRTVYEIDHLFDLILDMVDCKKTQLNCMLLEKRSKWRAASVLWREMEYPRIDHILAKDVFCDESASVVSIIFRCDKRQEIQHLTEPILIRDDETSTGPFRAFYAHGP